MIKNCIVTAIYYSQKVKNIYPSVLLSSSVLVIFKIGLTIYVEIDV